MTVKKAIFNLCSCFLILAFLSHSAFSSAVGTRDTRVYERYLDRIQTLQTTFTQQNPNGTRVTGKFYLTRPGYLKLAYDPPVKLLIFADGAHLVHVDLEIKEKTYLDLLSTPAGFLTAKNISFTGDVAVAEFSETSNEARIKLIRTKNPEEGAFTLIFQRHPLKLIQWIVDDRKGEQTLITLEDLKTNIYLDPKIYTIPTL